MTKKVAHIEAFTPEIDLEEELKGLVKYGKPHLSLLDRGWHCNIDMNTHAEGCSFDVKSDFGLPTPSDALIQCKERAVKAVATIAGSI